MRLITTEERLRRHLPNVISSVQGETPLLDRVASFLDLAEAWVRDTFTGSDLWNEIIAKESENRQVAEGLVVAQAMLRALPSLDLVLTPNGFAVVSTQNLAPVSKPRIDRLVGSLLTQRDEYISTLLPLLFADNTWFLYGPCGFFWGTLFPDLSVVDAVGKCDGPKWERYLELRPQIVDLEASLAEEWFSPELISAFRSDIHNCSLKHKRRLVIDQIKAQVVGYLRDGSFSTRRLADIVNVIRADEKTFPEWHGSAVAEQFSPSVFRNEKRSTGYFF